MFVLWQSDKCVNVRQQNIVSSTTVQDVIGVLVTRRDQVHFCFVAIW